MSHSKTLQQPSRKETVGFCVCFCVGRAAFIIKSEVKAVTNEFDQAEELYLDTMITAYQDGKDVYWYKFDMKKVTDRKNIRIISMGQSDYKGYLYLSIYNSSGESIVNGLTSSAASANQSQTANKT